MDDAEFDQPDFLEKLRAGDQGAYRRLIRRFHGALVGVASGIIGSRAQAEEVVQDAWLAVFSGIGRFEGRSKLASWLFTIVLNRARTRIGREGRMVGLPAILGGAQGEERAVDPSRFKPDGHWAESPKLWETLDPERVVGGRQLWDHVLAVIETMPAGQKAVIILRDMEGQDAEEVCALLRITPENQRVLLHRARARVRRAVESLTDAPATRAAPARKLAKPAAPGGQALGRMLVAVRRWWAGRSPISGIWGCSVRYARSVPNLAQARRRGGTACNHASQSWAPARSAAMSAAICRGWGTISR
jgi:RNA polymerase sigma-70 factor (ECF subfamily)